MRTNQDKTILASLAPAALALVTLALITAPVLANSPGDFDGSEYVDLADVSTFLSCVAGPEVTPPGGCEDADFDPDGDIDLRDLATFQTLYGHTPIALKDYSGNSITIDSAEPYSGRYTCGACHDVDTIANGFIAQQGRTDADGNVIMQDNFFGDGRWWIRSAGMYGTWGGNTNVQTAGKDNPHESEMDNTTFGWAAHCSGCHAGGGPGEFDRDGQLLYNQATAQFGYEVLGKTPEEVLYDGDYAFIDFRGDGSWSTAPWDVTGLSGPDCLFCHRFERTWAGGTSMNWFWRYSVLGTRTDLVDDLGDPVPAFSAAGTAAQGWFSNLDIGGEGPPTLQIDYSVGVADGSLLQNSDDTVDFSPSSLARPPTDKVCWGCHLHGGWKSKRGTVWFDERDVHFRKFTNRHDEDPGNDIPDDRATACNFCHPGGLHHNFAKGNSVFCRFRDELDFDRMRTCRECHLAEIPPGVPNPLKHPDSPEPVHWIHDDTLTNGRMMQLLSCQACHVAYALDQAAMVRDHALTGSAVTYYTDQFLSADPLDPTDPDKSTWYPALQAKTDSDGAVRFFPVKSTITIYWGDWDKNGTPGDLSDDTIRSIIAWRVRQITGGAPLPVVTDDNGDGQLEVNRPEEILAYLQALRGNDSYGRQVATNPVLVKGTHVWYEDPGHPDGVDSFAHQGTGIIAGDVETYGLDHNVLPREEAWGIEYTEQGVGVDTCGHCHLAFNGSDPTLVIDRLILVDPFGPDGLPVYQTVREMTGLNPP
jgi:hypothetical protein